MFDATARAQKKKVIISSIVHISTNIVLKNPKFSVVVDYIHLKGTVSQIMSKNG